MCVNKLSLFLYLNKMRSSRTSNFFTHFYQVRFCYERTTFLILKLGFSSFNIETKWKAIWFDIVCPKLSYKSKAIFSLENRLLTISNGEPLSFQFTSILFGLNTFLQ